MENENTLDYLLKVEAKAAALADEAQAQGAKRIHDNEEKNQAAFDERFKEEVKKRQIKLQAKTEEIKKEYHSALDEYRLEISGIKTDMRRFCELFNRFLAADLTADREQENGAE